MTEYLGLNATDCKHCYRCIRKCPVKAIRFQENQATIVPEECVLCGKCFLGCPQNAKRIRNDLPRAKALLAEGPVVASIAPSFVANYPGADIKAMQEALAQLGFAHADETALGATAVKQRYDEMVNEGNRSVILSTCCHTVNMLVQKYYPELTPLLAPVVSPMQAHCAMLKAQYPGAKTVFIGPCISKKAEAEEYPGIVDCVLTFEELGAWLAEAGVELRGEEKAQAKDAEGKARLFPTAGGILRSMEKANPDYHYIALDGMTKCIAALEDVASGELKNCFIEMSACISSCVGGPAMGRGGGPVRREALVDAYAPQADFSIEALPRAEMEKQIHYNVPARPRFGEAAIIEVLKKIGKTRPEDELNCGSCGYETCREKAQAVLAGKASLEMCMPYLMSKAQSFSDTIIKNTPNGVIVLSDALEVQQMNRAACRILNVRSEEDVLGRNIVCLMEPSLFLDVLDGERPVYDRRQYLAEYDRYVQFSAMRDKESGLLIGIMRDITDSETAKAARREMAEKTVQVTDEVIERQMRTVQEIASLLGETAAETQIALTKLKETLSHD